ncbi:hypothetical protein PRIC2_014312 [Phytophthora ramorum]
MPHEKHTKLRPIVNARETTEPVPGHAISEESFSDVAIFAPLQLSDGRRPDREHLGRRRSLARAAGGSYWRLRASSRAQRRTTGGRCEASRRRQGGAPEDDAQRQRRRLQWQFELAATETKRGRRQDAIVLYEGILQADSECVEAQVNLAAQLAIADASRLEEALELCMRALTLRPDLAEAHYNRNMLLRRLGRQEEAVNTYWECLARDLGDGVVRASMPDTLARVLLPLDGQNSIPKADKACNNATGDGLGNQEGGGDGVTVVCVKWGTKYGAEYVNRLYSSVMRHCGEIPPPQLAFVCLTDNSEGIDPHANLHVIPLDSGWKGWWNKCQLFSTALTSKLRAHGNSRCLYVDLDTVVVGNLGELMTWSPPAGMLALLKTDHMANEQRAGGYNSSIMAWRIDSNDDVDSLEFLYSFLHVHFSSVNKFIYKFDHWLEMAHPAAHFVEDTFPDQIVEYRSLDDQAATPPPNASIVCFPLLPKPHRATAPWIAQHWV